MNPHRENALKAMCFRTAAILLLAFAACTIGAAPQVRDMVLDQVEITRSDGNLILQVNFSFPLRYVSHFPPGDGSELRIRLSPIQVPPSDEDAVFKRESITPPYADTIALDEVIYEGDVDSGPYLTVRFLRPVRYEVVPGADYRSCNVIVLAIE